jgi:drug/metabolite transporter (DMT)-like permease
LTAALLALASSVSWGLSDFLGGFQSRRHAVLTVMTVSQGFALVLIAVAIAAGAPTGHDLAASAWAAGVGAFGVLGLAAFYRALAIGTMSVVAPISATGVAIPVLVGLVGGERPSALQVAGIALAAGGVILAARAPGAEGWTEAGRGSIALALLAAVGFGTFFAGIDRAEETADVAWVLLCTRLADIALLATAFAVARPALPRDPHVLGALAAVGFFDLFANLLFVLAAGRGLLSVVGVLGSLYPAFTVVLARFVLGERLSRAQGAGVVICLAGVVALASG